MFGTAEMNKKPKNSTNIANAYKVILKDSPKKVLDSVSLKPEDLDLESIKPTVEFLKKASANAYKMFM